MPHIIRTQRDPIHRSMQLTPEPEFDIARVRAQAHTHIIWFTVHSKTEYAQKQRRPLFPIGLHSCAHEPELVKYNKVRYIVISTFNTDQALLLPFSRLTSLAPPALLFLLIKQFRDSAFRHVFPDYAAISLFSASDMTFISTTNKLIHLLIRMEVPYS